MTQSTSSSPAVPKPWPVLATVLTIALIVFGLAWEMLIDPLRPGGSWLALKVLPLVFAVRGLWAGKVYTFKWMSLLVWFYVGEALVRIVGLSPIERLLAWNSLALSVGLSIAILLGARSQLKLAKAAADKAAAEAATNL